MDETRAFRHVGSVSFPEPTGIDINMMPLKLGDASTWTKGCVAYKSILDLCEFPADEVCYVSIHEAQLKIGESLRRPGVHTEATPFGNWGGAEWNGKSGIYQASTDGRCRIWDEMTDSISLYGALTREPEGTATIMEPGELYWMTDRTPHESLPVEVKGWRQWFRLVSPDIALWWAGDSTANPTGLKVPEDVRVMQRSKFRSEMDPLHSR
ncbi:MAG: hypothetical protein AB8H86_17200 [Polyangiales bacterium]